MWCGLPATRPLVDPGLVDEIIRRFKDTQPDYCSNARPTYPDGLDVEVFSLKALERAAQETHSAFDREHVTPYLKEPLRFRQTEVFHTENLSSSRWTVDEAADFEVISAVFDYFAPNIYFGWEEVVELERSQPQLFHLNRNIARNEGASMSSGQKLWKRAKVSFRVATCCYRNGQKCFCQTSNRRITARPKTAAYGI